MFVQLLLPELLWERKFSTAGEPRVSPEHLQHPPVSPSARIQADWAGREADFSCKPQKDAFLSHPYLSFSDFSWLAPPWCALTQPLLSAAGVGAIWSHHHSVMDGVRGDATLTPAYLSVPGYPNLDTFSPL